MNNLTIVLALNPAQQQILTTVLQRYIQQLRHAGGDAGLPCFRQLQAQSRRQSN